MFVYATNTTISSQCYKKTTPKRKSNIIQSSTGRAPSKSLPATLTKENYLFLKSLNFKLK